MDIDKITIILNKYLSEYEKSQNQEKNQEKIKEKIQKKTDMFGLQKKTSVKIDKLTMLVRSLDSKGQIIMCHYIFRPYHRPYDISYNTVETNYWEKKNLCPCGKILTNKSFSNGHKQSKQHLDYLNTRTKLLKVHRQIIKLNKPPKLF